MNKNANKYIPITNYHKVTKWIKKKTHIYAASEETHCRSRDTQTESEGWKTAESWDTST